MPHPHLISHPPILPTFHPNGPNPHPHRPPNILIRTITHHNTPLRPHPEIPQRLPKRRPMRLPPLPPTQRIRNHHTVEKRPDPQSPHLPLLNRDIPISHHREPNPGRPQAGKRRADPGIRLQARRPVGAEGGDELDEERGWGNGEGGGGKGRSEFSTRDRARGGVG
ncbi:hypothetical protein GCM10009839_31540 [Catenulispora yoronensis]|uniref:Uncharacterized protein n=1 Tax=Catenulispora yoronensis TaxID=450799 RepID=A0ABP5FP03_9ACTN